MTVLRVMLDVRTVSCRTSRTRTKWRPRTVSSCLTPSIAVAPRARSRNDGHTSIEQKQAIKSHLAHAHEMTEVIRCENDNAVPLHIAHAHEMTFHP